MAARTRGAEDVRLAVLAGGVAVIALCWLSACISASLCGHSAPRWRPAAAFSASMHPGDPSVAWGSNVGPAVAYWACTVLVLIVAAFGAYMLRGLATDIRGGARSGGSSTAGVATRREIKRAAGSGRLLGRRDALRPSLTSAAPVDLGFRLGRARGVECWASVEDSMVLLGPPRAGKGLHTVIPAILDAPGAVVTTSTRPDNLAVTMDARGQRGPVVVFDPQGLASLPATVRWSPVRGCERPQVAMARARALCAEPSRGMENATFWSQQCATAVRCLLHAAALGHRPPVELYRWSLSPLAAHDAADILASDPAAAPAWDVALEAILAADPRQRDSTWSMIANVFAPLADPQVLEAVSPAPGEGFDPQAFLRTNGTLYLLGTASGASATATLVAALVEDVVETARRLAATSPGARLDPPLALILDEAANYPLPSLPALMSEGGGTGITTLVALQSLAQARQKWGTDGAAAIWDAAIVKLILGGSGNAADLRDLSALIGTRIERRASESRGPDGSRSVSYASHEVPILDTGRLRTLPFGQGVLLLRSAPPILLDLQPWTSRRDADELSAGRERVESVMGAADTRAGR